MPLSDKNIKSRCPSFMNPFNEENVGSMCYDLTTQAFCISPDDERKKMELLPGESVYVACNESVKMPENLCATIHLRNNRIRQGLALDAPTYQPGHETRIFFRITNVSKQAIALDDKNGIASITFDVIMGKVEKLYAGDFQDEMKYEGLGKYASKLSPDIKTIDEKLDSIKNIERNVYTNVLSIMAIFVGIFTLINVNITSTMQGAGAKLMLVLNLTTVGAIGFLVAMINTILPDGKNQKIAWCACIFAFAAAVIIQLAVK